ncbi:hypothetical protein FVE85_7062 [Porphyridium purpureum]|uniref:Uncharacterized protein n=1 Tax=Porphyridium purpureum TaxID=35688 RepID=A0A5J4ZA14_PORPP|nr:hypothetical protein FVE85_7062 [Porphyridium purpureum]|eukprot:POR2511..scf295_1
MAGRVVANLREQCAEREEELEKLLAELDVLNQAKAVRQAELGNLRNKWDQGGLYNTEVKKTTIVDVHGDMSVKENYNQKMVEQVRMKKAAAAAAGTTYVPTAEEERFAGEFEVPEWAKNQERKKIVKETVASDTTKDVKIDSKKQALSAEALRESEKKAVQEKGDVKGMMSKFAMFEQQQEEDPRAKVMKEREARKAKEKVEAAEKAAREAEEKLRAAEEAKKADAQKGMAKLDIKSRFPSLPDEEPTDIAELSTYLNTKKQLLDEELIKVKKQIQNFV